MRDDLHLYYAPDNASLCVRLLLERLDIPFKTVLVDRQANGQKDPAYLALNPNGVIPTLVTPDETLFETGAILLWLADQHAGTVFPAHDAAGRGSALKWMFWLSNTMHPTLRHIFYAAQYGADPKSIRALAKDRVRAQLDIAEAAHAEIAPHDAQLCYLVPMLRWLMLYGGHPGWLRLDAWPNLARMAAAFETAPFAQRAASAEGLGPHPFTKPTAPNPPEGSAT